jgi:hypothetical protein
LTWAEATEADGATSRDLAMVAAEVKGVGQEGARIAARGDPEGIAQETGGSTSRRWTTAWIGWRNVWIRWRNAWSGARSG